MGIAGEIWTQKVTRPTQTRCKAHKNSQKIKKRWQLLSNLTTFYNTKDTGAKSKIIYLVDIWKKQQQKQNKQTIKK